jgi:hypothetical protein
MFMQAADVIRNHKNAHIHDMDTGKAAHRKYETELSGGQDQDRSSD